MFRKYTTMKKNYTLLLFVLFFVNLAHGQLANFNLELTKTNETCLGNGSLTFSITNQTPNSSILYKVFLLPDEANPLTVLSGNYLGSLSAGDYKIIAIQTLGNLINQQEKSITINNEIVAFNFEVTAANQTCSGGGDIIVNVISGTGTLYEIIYGPEKRPLQSSNVFEDLPAGTYNIRSFNNCGVAKVKTYTLIMYANALSISDAIYPDASNTICDSIRVMNKITSASGMIAYPISVKTTLHPSGVDGEPVVLNQTFTSGEPEVIEVFMVVPRFLLETYTYDILVTDNCNTVYEKTDIIVNPGIDLVLIPGEASCAEKFINLNVTKYTTSYTVNIISSPEGFDPIAFNETPNGPFFTNIISYGNESNPVPFGKYVFEITDLCGRTVTDSLSLEFLQPIPTKMAVNNGCFSEFGYIRVSMPDSKITMATITEAPGTYSATLPEDIIDNINTSGGLELNNMPLGNYKIAFTDDCGFVYEIDVEVLPYVEKPFTISTLPSCVPNFGTVRASSGNGVLTSVYITSAPSSLGQSLPYNISMNIASNGVLYMDNLPTGMYIFQVTDTCGLVKDLEIKIEGYNEPVDSFEFIPNCGAFSVDMHDASNGIEAASYWVQYYNEMSNTWGSPVTNEPYIEGSLPTTATGVFINNNEIHYNFNYNGKFRIVKKFESYGNGTPKNSICISVLGEFNYIEGFSITAGYTLACIGQPNSVILEIEGYPVSYKIKEKNGEPFLVDNGANNIFTNLEPAEYLFVIEDACGNIDIKGFNVQTLPSIAETTKPSDMIVCTEEGTLTTYQYHLTDQNPVILGPLHSAMYTITYHVSQEDADNGVNPLPEYYNNLYSGQTIYVRLIHNEIAVCHGTTSFKLFIGENPVPNIITEGTICNEGKVAITAEPGFKNYYWSNGETTRTIYVDEPGIYTVIVEKAYGDRTCDGFNEVEIITSVTPTITKIDTADWTWNENSIIVGANGSGSYEYSIDGMNYQEENVFTGLKNGIYNVYVKDAKGCGEVVKEVVLLNYPNFFTPNGDGVHDKWRIEYAIREPNIKINIFDRYGKLITVFGANSEGWDGTLNGNPLPSTDYWFVVEREDGRQLKGHFAMLR